MRQCKQCNQMIDDKAKVCPYCGKKQTSTAKTIILILLACLVPVIILVTILIVSFGALVANSASNTVSRVNLESQEAQTQNAKFDMYLRSYVSSTDVQNMLLAIKNNNTLAIQKNEPSVIGVCLLSKNIKNNENDGVYYYDKALSGDVTKSTLENMNFSSDVETISNQIIPNSTYNVNIANTTAWKDDAKGITGFENGQVQTGSTGGYYSSGFYRLIYIEDNNTDNYTQANSNSNDINTNSNSNSYISSYTNSTTIDENIVSDLALNSQEAIAQNSKFESYFGNDVTATEVKNLLSEIRTNNLTSDRNGTAETIGVCMISKDATTNTVYGLYSKNDLIGVTEPYGIYDNLYFCPEVKQFTATLNVWRRYTVNVPNNIAWKGDVNGKTGFETADNSMGQSITGNSGGYYSNGEIRLIFIYEND